MKEKLKISVYSDEGAGAGALRNLIHSLKAEEALRDYEIVRLGKNGMADPAWCSSTALLIFPGGRDIYYHRDLQGLPNQLIRDYVGAGGSYLGICAGAYYGCASISFEEGNSLEIKAERELAFFKGVARGPAYGTGLFQYGSEAGARVSYLKWCRPDRFEGKEYCAYFNGGCEFIDAEEDGNATVLARYSDMDRGAAAVVECRIGKGKAILCGVHPEYASHGLDSRDPYLVPIKEKLQAQEENRKEFFTNLLCLALNVKN